MEFGIDSGSDSATTSAGAVEFSPQMGKTMTRKESVELARRFCRTSTEAELLELMIGKSIPYLHRRDAEILAERLRTSGVAVAIVGQQHVPYEPPYGDCGEIHTFAVFGRAAWIFRSLELDLTDRQLYYHQLLARFQTQTHGDEWYFIRNEIGCAFEAAQRLLEEIGARLQRDDSVVKLMEYSGALVRISLLIRDFIHQLRPHLGVGAPSDEQLERDLSPVLALDEDFAIQLKAAGDDQADLIGSPKRNRTRSVTMQNCQARLANGELCQEELKLEENIGKEQFGKIEPAIHHGEGVGYTHHACRLGHAWHRNLGNGLLTPCDCTGHARGGF